MLSRSLSRAFLSQPDMLHLGAQKGRCFLGSVALDALARPFLYEETTPCTNLLHYSSHIFPLYDYGP